MQVNSGFTTLKLEVMLVPMSLQLPQFHSSACLITQTIQWLQYPVPKDSGVTLGYYRATCTHTKKYPYP